MHRPDGSLSLQGEFDLANRDLLHEAVTAFAQRCIAARRCSVEQRSTHDRSGASDAVHGRDAAGSPSPGSAVADTEPTVLDALHDAVIDAMFEADSDVDLGATEPQGADAVLDVEQLRFIDATSLGVLVTLQQTLAADGIRLCIRHPSAMLRRVSSICSLDAALGLEPAPTASAGLEPNLTTEPPGSTVLADLDDGATDRSTWPASPPEWLSPGPLSRGRAAL